MSRIGMERSRLLDITLDGAVNASFRYMTRRFEFLLCISDSPLPQTLHMVAFFQYPLEKHRLTSLQTLLTALLI
jgi:hypothetical protein